MLQSNVSWLPPIQDCNGNNNTNKSIKCTTKTTLKNHSLTNLSIDANFSVWNERQSVDLKHFQIPRETPGIHRVFECRIHRLTNAPKIALESTFLDCIPWPTIKFPFHWILLSFDIVPMQSPIQFDHHIWLLCNRRLFEDLVKFWKTEKLKLLCELSVPLTLNGFLTDLLCLDCVRFAIFWIHFDYFQRILCVPSDKQSSICPFAYNRSTFLFPVNLWNWHLCTRDRWDKVCNAETWTWKTSQFTLAVWLLRAAQILIQKCLPSVYNICRLWLTSHPRSSVHSLQPSTARNLSRVPDIWLCPMRLYNSVCHLRHINCQIVLSILIFSLSFTSSQIQCIID